MCCDRGEFGIEPNIGRLKDPREKWEKQKNIYPHFYRLALGFVCIPASSVPCKGVFKGEIVSKKRNHSNPNTVEKLLVLNKNE